MYVNVYLFLILFNLFILLTLYFLYTFSVVPYKFEVPEASRVLFAKYLGTISTKSIRKNDIGS